MTKRYQPTTQDFEKFKREFNRCADLLNLGDWRITFGFTKLNDTCFAMIDHDASEHWAHVRFNKDTIEGSDLQVFDPKRSARHEAAHLFTATLEHLGKCRYVIPDQFSCEIERMARVLEAIL